MGNLPSAPAPPTITEKNLGDQCGKVFLITGATSGIGRELAQILYAANAKVWITARSKTKGQQTISDIKAAAPKSRGSLELLVVDFNDLRTIKPAADDFLNRETRLHVLWNNAGIMTPPTGTVTAQGHEAQMGVNAVAPFLFTKLLADILQRTAQSITGGEARVVWVSSSAAAGFSPPGGVDMKALAADNKLSQWQRYGMSKAANILQASECARRYGAAGITSVAVDPGNLDTNLYQNMPKYQHFIAKKLALKPAIYGAYSELFAGISGKISSSNNGVWVIPWGETAMPRKDIDEACKLHAGGGSGIAEQFWIWCEQQVAAYIEM